MERPTDPKISERVPRLSSGACTSNSSPAWICPVSHHRPPPGPRMGRLTSVIDDAVDTVIWSATESAATIIAASIPVLRKFLKEKITSAVTYVQGSTGRSKNSGQRTADQSNGAKQSVHLSNLSSKGTSSKPRTRTYSELDDIDDESGRSILREYGDQSQQSAGLQMPPPGCLAT